MVANAILSLGTTLRAKGQCAAARTACCRWAVASAGDCNSRYTSVSSWYIMIDYDYEQGNYAAAAADQASLNQTTQNAKSAGCTWA
jgi:hypothetical protein